MAKSSYDSSNSSLDDILRELEERFGSDKSQSQVSSTKRTTQSSSPRMLVGALALFLTLGGTLIGTHLTNQNTTVTQQAMVPAIQNGSVQGVQNVAEPQLGFPRYSLSEISTPVKLTGESFITPIGLECSNTFCQLATEDWSWVNEEDVDVSVSCSGPQQVWKYYCPEGLLGTTTCQENEEFVMEASSGDTIELSSYVTSDLGVYQFNFVDPQTLATSATCGAVQVEL